MGDGQSHDVIAPSILPQGIRETRASGCLAAAV